MQCESKFEEIYKRAPEGVAFCPYRICPIGAHSDHNLGKITASASSAMEGLPLDDEKLNIISRNDYCHFCQ